MILPEQKLDALVARLKTVEDDLAAGPDRDTYVKLSREFSELQPLVASIKTYRGALSEIADLDALLADPATDREMRALAEAEKPVLEARRDALAQDIRRALIPKDAMDERNVVLEIRAGTGGDEAALFAGDLFRMYSKFAERLGWRIEVMSSSDTGVGGVKEVIAMIEGRGAYSKLKYESGVHRVQRVPVTESQGRVHTSTATVAVLPEAEDVEVEINPKDLQVDTYKASGAGGQYVNKTESAIRITHKPSGVVVSCSQERSQLQNRDRAMRMLRAVLVEHKRREAAEAVGSLRKSQVGTGDRSEKIRTYNFPQDRITDHRINENFGNIPAILDGDLGKIVAKLQADEKSRLLAGPGSAA